ncbi:YcxB family protein [Chloroflexota bacterium]
MTTPSKRFVTITAIAAVAALTIMWLIIGLIMHAPQITLLWIALIAIGTGTTGALIGWLILKLTYPGLRSNGEISPIDRDAQANLREKMYVEYELNNDDILSFYSYKYEHSPGPGRARKLIRRTLLSAIAVELIAALVLGVAFGNQYLLLILLLCVFALLTLLYYVFSPSVMRKSLRGTVTRNYGQGKDKLTGKHKLSIATDAVTDSSDVGESITRWNAVEWIESTDQYLFVMVRGSGPHIVPRRAFANEEAFRQFVDTAKAYRQTVVRS